MHLEHHPLHFLALVPNGCMKALRALRAELLWLFRLWRFLFGLLDLRGQFKAEPQKPRQPCGSPSQCDGGSRASLTLGEVSKTMAIRTVFVSSGLGFRVLGSKGFRF